MTGNGHGRAPANLPPPGSADAPKYWRHETGGELAEAVEKWLTGARPMTMRDLALMRAYCMQWVDSRAWDLNPYMSPEARAALAGLRASAREIQTVPALSAWLARAVEMGMDPL